MLHKCIIYLTLLLLVAFVQGQKLIQPGPPDSCFKTKSIHRIDRYYKDVPSPEGSDFPVCQSWKESSCCTRALAEELSHSKTGGLYNLSPVCAKYLRVCVIAFIAIVTFHCKKHNNTANSNIAMLMSVLFCDCVSSFHECMSTYLLEGNSCYSSLISLARSAMQSHHK